MAKIDDITNDFIEDVDDFIDFVTFLTYIVYNYKSWFYIKYLIGRK